MKQMNLKKVLLIITYTMCLFFILYRAEDFGRLFGTLFGILFPFIVGASIAFIFSIPMNAIEKKICKNGKYPILIRLKRPISFVISLVAFIGVITIVLVLIIPALSETFQKILDTVPGFVLDVKLKLENSGIVKDLLNANLLDKDSLDKFFQWNQENNVLLPWVKTFSTGVLSSTIGIVSSVAQGVTQGIISVIFALYVLFQKETLARQTRMLLYAAFPEKFCDSVLGIAALTHKTFSSFFSGQCVEACILGSLFVIMMSILRIPYAMLIGVLIAVTALIPVFGAFIGCITGILLIIMVDPIKAVIFLVLFLILQQIEGNLIYPKVVGSSVGLPSIWVLVAVTTGASLLGILGMLIFIPLFSVTYNILGEVARYLLEKKHIAKEKWDVVPESGSSDGSEEEEAAE